MRQNTKTAFTFYFDGCQWALPVLPEVVEVIPTFYEKADAYPVDGRGLVNYFAFSTIKHLGASQFYLAQIQEKNGYHLVVPANAPVTQYWSATVYDRATQALIRDLPRSSRSSQNPDLNKNADGSTDIYFGPKAPAGKESNGYQQARCVWGSAGTKDIGKSSVRPRVRVKMF